MAKLRKPVDKDKWATEPAVVNAFYNPNKNDIGNDIAAHLFQIHRRKHLGEMKYSDYLIF